MRGALAPSRRYHSEALSRRMPGTWQASQLHPAATWCLQRRTRLKRDGSQKASRCRDQCCSEGQHGCVRGPRERTCAMAASSPSSGWKVVAAICRSCTYERPFASRSCEVRKRRNRQAKRSQRMPWLLDLQRQPSLEHMIHRGIMRKRDQSATKTSALLDVDAWDRVLSSI